MIKQFSIVKGLLFVFLIIGLLAGCSREKTPKTTEQKQEDTSIISEKPTKWLGYALDFTAVKVDKNEFKFSSLKGKVILLNFWAVDCPFCKMQIPVLVELYKGYKDEGLEVVGVCLKGESLVKSFAETMSINYTLVFANREIESKYQGYARFIPTTLVIDRQGNIVEKYVGYTSKETIEKEIKEFLQIENR